MNKQIELNHVGPIENLKIPIPEGEQPVNSFVVMDDQPTPEPPRDGSSWDEYCQVRAMNGSTLVHGLTSMLHLKHSIDNPKEQTPAMMLGTVTHLLLLEPEEFENRFVVMPDYQNDEANRTKPKKKDEEGKQTTSKATAYYKSKARQFFEDARSEGKEVVRREEYDKSLAMIEAVRGNKCASMWLDDPNSRKEVTVVGEIEGVVFKGRIDILHPSSLTDIKTSRIMNPFQFGKFAYGAGYLFKQAIHRELVYQMTGEKVPVRYTVVENDPPYDCAVYEFERDDEEIFDQELKRVCKLIRKYKECIKNDVWPGVDGGDDYVRFPIPDYAMEVESISGWGGE